MNRIFVAVGLIGVAGLVGCDARTPSGPSSVSQPTTPAAENNQLVMFADPHSSFSTSDLYDADEQVVRITVGGNLIWMADGTRLPGFSGGGNSIAVPGCACTLVVRFGTRDGERRAYLTADYIHDNPGTLVRLGISGVALTITRTTVFAPGTYTLSGLITETSANGPIPVEDATVWRLNEERSAWQVAQTDKNGSYEMHGLYDGDREVAVIKDGYDTAKSVVLIIGDTRFDSQIEALIASPEVGHVSAMKAGKNGTPASIAPQAFPPLRLTRGLSGVASSL